MKILNLSNMGKTPLAAALMVGLAACASPEAGAQDSSKPEITNVSDSAETTTELAQLQLDQIAANYKDCIAEEIEAATEDGVLDEEFFEEGKEHCNEIRDDEIKIAASRSRITAMNDEMIAEIKADAGL